LKLAACQAERLKSAIIPSGDSTPLQSTQPGPNEAHQLPTRQWLAVEAELPIIDGKVAVVLQQTKLSNGKAHARIAIRIPMRKKPFTRTIKRAGVMEFDYNQRSYKLTANNIDLQKQRVQITIIEM